MKKVFCLMAAGLILGAVTVLPVFAADGSWSEFGVGSWVLYELNGAMQQKHILIDKTDTKLVMRMENILMGKVISSVDVDSKISRTTDQRAADQDAKPRESTADVKVKGVILSCKVYETETEQGLSKAFVSDKVPGGLVEAYLGDKPVMKLIDYEAK